MHSSALRLIVPLRVTMVSFWETIKRKALAWAKKQKLVT